MTMLCLSDKIKKKRTAYIATIKKEVVACCRLKIFYENVYFINSDSDKGAVVKPHEMYMYTV